jgi:hypothetical protein
MPKVKKVEEQMEEQLNVEETKPEVVEGIVEEPVTEEVPENEVEEEPGPIMVCPTDKSTRFRILEYVNRVHANGESEEMETTFQCTNCHGEYHFEKLVPQQSF